MAPNVSNRAGAAWTPTPSKDRVAFVVTTTGGPGSGSKLLAIAGGAASKLKVVATVGTDTVKAALAVAVAPGLVRVVAVAIACGVAVPTPPTGYVPEVIRWACLGGDIAGRYDPEPRTAGLNDQDCPEGTPPYLGATLMLVHL